jgi:DNA-binding HxlR family transcriptional regulator
MLIQHLKQLEADKIIIREAKPVVPPYVTYSLSPSGMGLRPVMYAMATWAVEDSEANGTPYIKTWGSFPGIAEGGEIIFVMRRAVFPP